MTAHPSPIDLDVLAVNVVLYDRMAKAARQGNKP
jgi:hypothetical protein